MMTWPARLRSLLGCRPQPKTSGRPAEEERRPPGHWEIVLAYLRGAYEARAQGEEFAMGTVVEQQLGLSQLDAIDFMRELEEKGLIKMAEAENAVAAYRLAPRGLAVMEKLPSLESVLREQMAAVDASPGPAAEKEQAKFSLRNELYKIAIQKGVDMGLQNASAVWQSVQTLYQWLRAWRPSA